MVYVTHCKFGHREKQLGLLLVWTTATLTGGAVFESYPIASHLLRADGRGRFSGTMVSSEFTRQAGQLRLSLHFVAFPRPFDSATTNVVDDEDVLYSLAAIWVTETLLISNPIIMQAEAMPIRTQGFDDLHDSNSFFFLHRKCTHAHRYWFIK